jgi:hypothetical protein
MGLTKIIARDSGSLIFQVFLSLSLALKVDPTEALHSLTCDHPS